MDTNAASMGMQSADLPPEGPQFDLRDVVAILKRRLWHVIIPFVLLAPVAVAVALLLPAVWQSQAIILIEQPDIPPQLVSSTVTSFADQRVQIIKQKVTATDVLVGVMDKFDLYREQRQTKPISLVVEEMREAISVEFISANVTDPRGGRPQKATIAFSIAFDYEDPRSAQRVANEFVSLFLSENVRTRQRQAEQAASFLAQEVVVLEKQIAGIEEKISTLRKEYDGSLPEQKTYNVEKLDRANLSLRDVDRQVFKLQDTKSFLETQLAQTNPYGTYQLNETVVLSPVDRLKALRSQVVTLTTQYTEKHPDVVRLKQEIAELEKRIGPSGQSAAGVPAFQQRPDNPLYLQIESQINALDVELANLSRERDFLSSEIAEIEERLQRTPLVELEYTALLRSLDAANHDYQSVKQRQLTAQLGESLEEERRSERFSVVEPPTLPAEPVKPKRLLILIGGLILAIGTGFGVGILAEIIDPALHGPRQVAAVTGAEPLVVVPFIRTRRDRRRVMRRRLAVAMLAVAAVGGGLAVIQFKVMPLDVLWLRLERRISDQIGMIRS